MKYRTNFNLADFGFWVLWLKISLFVTVSNCAIRETPPPPADIWVQKVGGWGAFTSPPYITGPNSFR